jgi:hypothetical protein
MIIISTKHVALKYAAFAIVVLLCSVLFVLPAIKTVAQNHNRKVLQKNANVSFQIPSPGRQQVVDMVKMASITGVFPYYDVVADIQIPLGSTLAKFPMVLIEEAAQDSFPFTVSALRINKATKPQNQSVLYADYAFAKSHKIHIGDELVVQFGNHTLNMPLVAIIENPGVYVGEKEVLIAALQPTYFTGIEYSGAYLQSQNRSQTKSFLRDYKPAGLLRNRSAFKSDADYEAYLKDYDSRSYEAEIRDFSQISFREAGVFGNVILVFLFVFVTIIISALVTFTNNATKNLIRTRINNGQPHSKTIAEVQNTILCETIWGSVLGVVFFGLFYSSQTFYCPLSEYIPIFLISIGCPLLCSILFARIFAVGYIKKIDRDTLVNGVPKIF